MERVFTYIWEYKVRSDKKEAFLKLYGCEGDWVRFFNKSEEYLGTDLHQDIDNEERFISVDFWKSKEARDDYRKEFNSEFNSLDEQGELTTESETPIGEFYVYSDRFEKLK